MAHPAPALTRPGLLRELRSSALLLALALGVPALVVPVARLLG